MFPGHADTLKGDESKVAWARTANFAETYDRTTKAIMPAMGAILDSFKGSFLPNFQPPTTGNNEEYRRPQCLDIGCGPGRFTLHFLLPRLPAWCEKLVAVDHAAHMLDFARNKRSDPKIEYSNLDLMVDADVARFVVEQGQFHMVFSFLTLHWISDQHHALHNIAALMEPGGECFLVFAQTLVMFDLYVALMKSPRWKKYSDILKPFIPATHYMDVMSMRSHVASLVSEANLILLAGEVFLTTADMNISVEEAADFYTKRNHFHCLLKEEEKQELWKFTYDFVNGLSKQDSGRRLREHHILVIHAFKARK